MGNIMVFKKSPFKAPIAKEFSQYITCSNIWCDNSCKICDPRGWLYNNGEDLFQENICIRGPHCAALREMDEKEVQENLQALGYDDLDVDTVDTVDTVQQIQEHETIPIPDIPRTDDGKPAPKGELIQFFVIHFPEEFDDESFEEKIKLAMFWYNKTSKKQLATILLQKIEW